MQSVQSFTYSRLADDVGGVGFCLSYCLTGCGRHSKQVLCFVLQQPVNQSLQQRQLRERNGLTEKMKRESQ